MRVFRESLIFFGKEWEFNRSGNRVRKEGGEEEDGMRGPCGLSKMFLNAGSHMLHFWILIMSYELCYSNNGSRSRSRKLIED